MQQVVPTQEVVRPLDNGFGATETYRTQEKHLSHSGTDFKVVISVISGMYRFQVFAKRFYKYSLVIDRAGLNENELAKEWLDVDKRLSLYGM